MIKKFRISLLVTVVFAGLILFSYSQVVAQPPTDAARILTCQVTTGYEQLKLEFDATGQLTAASWCEADGRGECMYGYKPLSLFDGYLVAGTDIRLIQNAELVYWCQGPLGGCMGGRCFPKFP